MAHPPFRPAYTRLALRMLVANLFSTTALTLVPTLANANPLGGQVVAGSATIGRPDPASVAVTQTSPKAVINWNSFSIGAGEQTTFVQPNAQAITLNRVVGVDPSKIMGTLKANGQVWLVNPNGIVFGKTAQVDVGGLLATTLDIGTSDFMAGNYKFSGPANSGAMVVNAGQITVSDAGLAALVAPGVENSGIITARLGKIQLASTAGFTVDLNGDGTFNFLLDKQVSQQLVRTDGTTPSAAISNSGSLIADGGTILLTANAAKSVVDDAIDMSGYAQARSANLQGGTIILNGGDGTVQVSGTLDASAPLGGNGGFIETSAAHVQVTNGAIVTTTAPLGKTGTWLIDPHDFTIASSGGDIMGSALTTALGSTNVTLQSSNGGSGTTGDINVNDAVSWSANTLTLTAANNINVNAVMTASSNASLALKPATANGTDAANGSGTVLMGMNSSDFIGRVDFSGTGTLSISSTPYTVINSLGVAGDTGTTTLQGMQNNLTGHYALGSDIDASTTATWVSGKGFSPIGASNIAFSGVLNGLGHTITGLTITNPNGPHVMPLSAYNLAEVGLFGNIQPPGVISNLGLTGYSITDNAGSLIGALAGISSSSVSNVYANGSVSGTSNIMNVVGGLVGLNGITLNNVHALGTVTSTIGWVGGLAGDNGGTITNSYAGTTMTTNGGATAGGLVGLNNGYIISSYSTGTVTGVGSYSTAGGAVGTNSGVITDVHATGAVTVTADSTTGSSNIYAGGLVGENATGLSSIGTITNAYATGDVTGNGAASDGSGGSTVGGLVASNSGAISKSYATGTVSGGGNGGGLVGINNAAGISTPPGSISQSYATGAVTGNSFYGYGGLVGTNEGTITQSYAIGPVTGTFATSSVGSLIGANYSSISESYATGTVVQGGIIGGLLGYSTGIVSSSYWDTQTTDQSTSAGGTGLTTAQLKSGLPAGFDSAVWAISPSINNGYPYLLALVPSSGGTVTLIPVTWSVADAFGTYGTLSNFGALTLSGISSSDSGSVFGTLGLFSGTTAVTLAATTPAGTYSEEVTGLSGSAAGNYSLATSGDTIGTLVIAPKALTWSVTNASSTFGTTPTLGTAHLSGIVGSDNVNGTAGAFSGNTPVTLSTSTPAGNYSENVTGLSGSAAGDYILASTGNLPGTLTVLAPTLTPTPAPIPAPPASSTLSSQQVAANQVLNQSANLSPQKTTLSYVPLQGLTKTEATFSQNPGEELLSELSKYPRDAASNAVLGETSKMLDFFAVNVLSKLSLPSSDLVALQKYMLNDIQQSFENITPGSLTIQLAGDVVSKVLQDAVQRGLADKGYSENSNVVVIARYWTDLTVQSTIAEATSGPAGPAAAILSAAETSVKTISEMAAVTLPSLNQNLSDIDWDIATNVQQQQQLVQKLQEAQGANDPNLVAHYELGLKSATSSLKAMYSAKQDILGGPLMWLVKGEL